MNYNNYKKMLLFVTYIMFVLGSHIFAQSNVTSRLDGLLDEAEFGYINNKKVVVKSINQEKIILESPILLGALDETIVDYVIIYNDKPIGDTFSDTSLMDQFKEKNFTAQINQTKFDMELNKSDSIDPNKTYFLYVIPKDEFGIPGLLSNEICFNLNANKFAEDEIACKTLITTSTHSSSGPDMNNANITHTINATNKTATIKRTSQVGANKLDLFLRSPEKEKFELLTSVNMSLGQHTFNINRNGEHNIKFIPNNNGTPTGIEKIYTFTTTGITTTTPTSPTTPTVTGEEPTKGITKVPVVGPKEDIAMILIISVFGYLAYRKFRKKY